MKTPRLFLLAALSLPALSLPGSAAISFVEDFLPDTGTQATSGGETFADYPDWELRSLNTASAFNARVTDSGGELALANGFGTNGPVYAVVSSTSGNLASAPAFDASSETITVSADLGSRFFPDGVPSRSVGVNFGNVAFLIHPGADALGGAHRVQTLDGSTIFLGNTDMGFTPGTNDEFTPVSISVIEAGSDYEFSYSIGSYTNSITLARSDVDDTVDGLSTVGLWVDGRADGNYQNFSVNQVPEPSAAMLAGLGLLGLASLRRRDH